MTLNSSALGCLLFVFLLIFIYNSAAQAQVFDISKLGAKADGISDSRPALNTAWTSACAFGGNGVVFVPKGNFLVSPLTLQGPCKGMIQLQIEGVLIAPVYNPNVAAGSEDDDRWIAIHQVNNLVINSIGGGGTLDGRGDTAWKFNNCTGSCTGFPVTLRLDQVNTARIINIKSLNSKFFHLKVYKSQDITFDNVKVQAPENSPNTDGIHISKSSNINILNSIISTGDDCISLGPGSKIINITRVQCGPGHGISIGSLGKNAGEEDVVRVAVQNSIFTGTTNGVRIKSWSKPFPSLVSNIVFTHLQMNNVKNPIIIDQGYCPHNSCNAQNAVSQSRVQIRDVTYEDIRGTSGTKMAVDFECSQVNPCQNIVMKDINLSFNGGLATSSCSNVKGSASGTQLPPSCF